MGARVGLTVVAINVGFSVGCIVFSVGARDTFLIGSSVGCSEGGMVGGSETSLGAVVGWRVAGAEDGAMVGFPVNCISFSRRPSGLYVMFMRTSKQRGEGSTHRRSARALSPTCRNAGGFFRGARGINWADGGPGQPAQVFGTHDVEIHAGHLRGKIAIFHLDVKDQRRST